MATSVYQVQLLNCGRASSSWIELSVMRNRAVIVSEAPSRTNRDRDSLRVILVQPKPRESSLANSHLQGCRKVGKIDSGGGWEFN